MPSEPTRLFNDIDYRGLTSELNQLRKEIDASLSDEDLRHLRKIEWWGRLCSAIGYATAWIFPNPLSAFLMSQGMITRWTMMMHHVGHKGYDKVPGVPPRYQSRVFARGWRRFLDFPDWIHPEAWLHEHNILHHYHTGEEADPDLVERNLMTLRMLPGPSFPKYPVALLLAMMWKWIYYAGSTLRSQKITRERPSGADLAQVLGDELRAYFDPRGKDGRMKVWRLYRPFAGIWLPIITKSLLPYALFRFALLPAAFLIISPEAAMNVLLTSLMAEVITNLHAFLIIVPNHCGDDLYKFDRPITDKAEFYVRQILGSVNYRTGSDLNDFLHGWLNYQIEHHLWPDLPMLRYQQVQPRVKEICLRYGVPYVQEGVFTRVGKLLRVMVGSATMPAAATVPRAERSVANATDSEAQSLSA